MSIKWEQRKQPSQQRIAAVINAFWDRMSPADKALRERLQGINAEKALELLDRLGPAGG